VAALAMANSTALNASNSPGVIMIANQPSQPKENRQDDDSQHDN
jgi:hypothetical protein